MALRYKDIGEIISLIDASSCDEFILETDEVKLVLRRHGAGGGGGGGTAAASGAASAASPSSGGSSAPDAAAAPAKRSATARPAPQDRPGVVSSPMVGTFYRAPAPDAAPFVDAGSKVKAGDPLCLIEVMKLFTTVYAEFAGTVREIGAEDGQLVEYGQLLFLIEPDEPVET